MALRALTDWDERVADPRVFKKKPLRTQTEVLPLPTEPSSMSKSTSSTSTPTPTPTESETYPPGTLSMTGTTVTPTRTPVSEESPCFPIPPSRRSVSFPDFSTPRDSHGKYVGTLSRDKSRSDRGGPLERGMVQILTHRTGRDHRRTTGLGWRVPTEKEVEVEMGKMGSPRGGRVGRERRGRDGGTCGSRSR